MGGCFQEEGWRSVLLYFIGKNFEEGVSVSSLNSKLSGLAFLLQLSGLPDATKCILVKKVLRGYQKGRPVSRRPVSFELLGVL